MHCANFAVAVVDVKECAMVSRTAQNTVGEQRNFEAESERDDIAAADERAVIDGMALCVDRFPFDVPR